MHNLLTIRPSEPEIVELSVSSWFYRNRAIAGFENPARSLYVSIREIVENSLDSCESISVLPSILVTLEAEEGEESEDVFSADPQLFHLTVQDNGSGMPKENVPRLIGKMLTGTKFQIKQSRGTFGLGGSLALLYGQVTTQRPIQITTGQLGSDHYDSLEMRLDIENNTPMIVDENIVPKSMNDHGTTISFSLKGDWLRSKKRILSYFEQTSVMVPYASIEFETPDDENFSYPRLTEQMPSIPTEMKPHPKGIDVEILKQMIANTKSRSIVSFLTNSFQQIGRKTAVNFLKFAKIDQDKSLSNLVLDDLVVMMDALEEYPKFRAPSAESLAPAGPKLLEAGISRLNPEFVVVRQRSPNVYSGHPFIIEIGVGYGGDLSPGITLLRYANRIPLLYDESSDVSNQVIRNLNLKNYNLKNEDPLLFLVHICSTKVPYKTVGKEYVADVDVVRREINLGFMNCLRELSGLVRKKHRVTRQKQRNNRLAEYYSFIASTLEASQGEPVPLTKLFPEMEDVTHE